MNAIFLHAAIEARQPHVRPHLDAGGSTQPTRAVGVPGVSMPADTR